MRHEDFSPILLTLRQASNGRASYRPAGPVRQTKSSVENGPVAAEDLRTRLETLHRNQTASGDRSLAEGESKTDRSSGIKDTMDLANLGDFVNTRRGGYSAEGSFRQRMLSSALNDTSELLPEESLQASTPKQFPTVRMQSFGRRLSAGPSPHLPPAPNPSPEKHARQSLSISPLKLFQPYDTFTTQTIMRRLSQLEGSAIDGSRASRSSSREQTGNPGDRGGGHNSSKPSPSLSVNDFGEGKLNGYQFPEDISCNSGDGSVLDGDKENLHPDSNSVQPARVPVFDVTHTSSPPQEAELFVQKARVKSSSAASSRPSTRPATRDDQTGDVGVWPGVMATPLRRDTGSEGKRARTSPAKDPTPKRRRTLHKSDVSYEADETGRALDGVHQSHQQMQSAIGKRRKGGKRSGDDCCVPVKPQAVAARPTTRPRTPTPSQRSSTQRERLPLAEIPVQPDDLSMETNRKPSIKTEDFINEANKIMAMIRNKAVKGSGLTSVEGSDVEQDAHGAREPESSFQESTREPFSRPPSREGRGPLARMPPRQDDPEVAQRLKKYEEASDLGDVIGSSMPSLGLSQDAAHAPQEAAAAMAAAAAASGKATNAVGHGIPRPSILDVDEVSDPPNLHLSENPFGREHRAAGGHADAVPSHGSMSSAQSTGRSTIPTGSSRGSETRKTIAPQSVQHLIGERVGDMVLDKDRFVWIRTKHRADTVKSKGSHLPSEDSEGDPFAGIPDLSVDATLELKNLKKVAAARADITSLGEHTAAPQQPSSSPPKPSTPGSMRRSALKGGSGSPIRGQDMSGTDMSPGKPLIRVHINEDVEHEIGLDEDRGTPARRNLTISFSSPIASIIQDCAAAAAAAAEDLTAVTEEPSMFDPSGGEPALRIPMVNGGRAVSMKPTSSSRSSSHGPMRRVSVRGQPFVGRPVSRIEERDEDGVLESTLKRDEAAAGLEISVLAGESSLADGAGEARRTSLSFVVATTPARPLSCAMAGVNAGPVISQYVGTFSLSPLSEFTVHRPDESMPLEASYIVDEHHLVTGDHTRRALSLNTRHLVDKLGEVEPFEPYWEDMRELVLGDKQLDGVHALDEFCARLESLDVSRNRIRNLGGVPASVRHLKAPHNQLSSLTAWAHLMNLQYVDVSNNNLASLSAFRDLVHLRELKVDNNQLTSLDGIKFHDGLQSLRARGNRIETLDFDGSRLGRLTVLDLQDNRLRRVANLDQLSVLNSLSLAGNRLEEFGLDGKNPLPSLRYLRLCDNVLVALSVAKLPHLRLLHADRNRLVRIDGLSRARRIDSLSLREQQGAEPLDISTLLSRAYEVRKLYLSGNLLPGGGFEPRVDLLNLQLLEMANCGLRTLPAHLGLMLPNLRVLNVNFNALTDLAPLWGVPRLKRILAAGNRLADSAWLAEVLADFEHLVAVDVRNNPITLGFYLPAAPGLSSASLSALTRRKTSGRGGSHEITAGEEPETRCESAIIPASHAAAAVVVDPFALPDEDSDRDRAYVSRLDLDTRMRRRLHETVLRAVCRRLRRLDGLPLARGDAAEVRDDVWRALAAQGLVSAVEEAESRLRNDTQAVDGAQRSKDETAEEAESGARGATWTRFSRHAPDP
ncbi:hypothetical protein P8C59_006291 [Phyllachora maydis]|uniref:Uncharacterized protein n=1 Tax=Phyllachora maydis TaxID=1825666 RepID=A0AAD9I6G3_9PEZI|nr:hypothetical protein P8C59_006291 [Phyllachora maydis]